MSYYDLQAVPRYIQYDNALREFKRHTYGMGKKFLVITACGPVTERVVNTVRESVENSAMSGYDPRFEQTNHKYAWAKSRIEEMDRSPLAAQYDFVNYDALPLTEKTARELAALVEKDGYDVVVGIGGGKGMDFARAAGFLTGCRMVIVPTVPSTNASATNYCVLYNEAGTQIEHFWALPGIQELVIAPTDVIVQSPPRMLAAGIGDTVSTYFEALNIMERLGREREFPAMSRDSILAGIDILMRQGPAAMRAAKAGEITHEYESVLSQILHSVGPIRAACISGVGHIIDEGLITHPGCKGKMHGELVGYGVIPMLCAENKPAAEIDAYVDFCRAVDIPVSFAELGIGGIDDEGLRQICQAALAGEMIKSFPYPLTVEGLVDMMKLGEQRVTA